MFQREVKHKTKLYTILAVLFALVLVSSIYVVTQPTVLYSLTGVSPLKNFASIDELKNYLLTNAQSDFTSPYPITPGGSINTSISSEVPDQGYFSSPSEPQFSSYSSTNIQVMDVDEADVVKTDGSYIYFIDQPYSGPVGSCSIQIVKADSKVPLVVGKITFDGTLDDSNSDFYYRTMGRTDLFGMYLSEDGNKLAVLGRNFYSYFNVGMTPVNNITSFIYVYDVSNKVEPKLDRNVTLSSVYNNFNSRMIGNYIYAVISQPIYVDDDSVVLPKLSTNTVHSEISPSNIYYAEMNDSCSSYSTFVSINLMDNAEQPTAMTILMGTSSCMYVSATNMYVTFTGSSASTEIYRVAIDGTNLVFEAQGIVPGYVLNQYSMDEYDNYFRIATTVSTGSWINRDEHNNIYILNMNLNIVGKVENLAHGERIYAARFIGDKAYLVTFEQIDPFFVLDLKDPTSPKVAGELKIPGYSNYLHPYNENYVIGIGKEDNTLKLSFFNVTDMNNPAEIAKYLIGENAYYSTSEALNEPKAFLFDIHKQLLVIPASIHQERTFWRGAYVFQLSPENGFTLQSEILQQHHNGNQNWLDNGYQNLQPQVIRSLYINNTLYTISSDSIQLTNLNDFTFITQITF